LDNDNSSERKNNSRSQSSLKTHATTNRNNSKSQLQPSKTVILHRSEVAPEVLAKFEHFNKYDVGLYRFFYAELESRIGNEGKDFQQEVNLFRSILTKVRHFCSTNPANKDYQRFEGRGLNENKHLAATTRQENRTHNEHIGEDKNDNNRTGVNPETLGETVNIPASRWDPGFTLTIDECQVISMEEQEMNYRARYTQLKRLKLLDEWTFTPPPVHLL
jgi:hypothetical protein